MKYKINVGIGSEEYIEVEANSYEEAKKLAQIKKLADTSEKLKKIGVSITDDNGNYRSLSNILEDMSNKYNENIKNNEFEGENEMINMETTKNRGFEIVDNNKNKEVETLLPLRGTKTSAGYDFYTPIDLIIKPQEKVFFWTDVKAYMNEGELLLLDVRSSMGVKNDLMMSNTIPVIDSDYYNNEGNEGNIGISLRNLKPSMKLNGYKEIHVSNWDIIPELVLVPIIEDLTEENTVVIKAGDRVAQGFFVNYLPSDNCNSEEERKGGFGSTTKGAK